MKCARKSNIVGVITLCSHSMARSLPLRGAFTDIESIRHFRYAAKQSHMLCSTVGTGTLLPASKFLNSITEGSIKFGCDGQATLEWSYSAHQLVEADEPSYDLIASSQSLVQASCITCNVHHITGHQENYSAIKNLDQ
jgi:hypothetical protein